MLEDVTARFRRPSVMDVKLGTRTFGADASAAKAAAEALKYPPQAEFGFRITGMRVYEGEHVAGDAAGAAGAGAYRVLERAFGLGLRSRAALVAGFSEFLRDARRGRVRTELVPPLLRRLREVEQFLEAPREFRFIGSSLLLVYEGAGEAGNGCKGGEGGKGGGEWEQAAASIDVRLIDFANAVWGADARDDGVLLGLRSVMQALEGVVECSSAAGARNPP